MSLETLTTVKSALESTEASPAGIEKLLTSLGYSILPQKEQLLDPDTLFQQKELRERVIGMRKLFSMQGLWKHPTTEQPFRREAAVVLIELGDEQSLKSRWPFEITRYAVKFGFATYQVVFFFTAPKTRSFVVSAYVTDTSDRIQVRRLIVDLDNIARTDIEAISGLLFQRMQPDTIIDEFRNALPYLKVGHEFFLQYHDLFVKLSKRVTPVLGSGQKAYGYVQRLLGRVTFLYFLQRKGWLDNDSAYIRKKTKKMNGATLFDFLYEIFKILNTEDHPVGSKGKIPYLNGSLFEDEHYPREQMKRIADACAPFLVDVLRTLDQYNFTISESTPLNKEVAVDPELLGSLFESMLPEAERGDKGTFYTHQEEMLFMAGEALRMYLERFPQILTRDQIFSLVYGLETASVPRIEPKLAREVKDRLRELKVLDPAVGSGGFLMAMLQKLLEIRTRLNGIIGALERDYDSKLEFIENNLFGVDIEEEAIELARLRLWLSLVVDEPLENVNPLPNLDQNLHRGDSLRIPEFEKQRQIKITVDQTVRAALLKEISVVRAEYSQSHGKKKEAKRLELDNALRKLVEIETGVRPPKVVPFSYRYFYADVMANGGFDLVLMNPPYIEQRDIGKLPGQDSELYKTEILEDIKELTGEKLTLNKQSDISTYFHVRALSLLNEGGAAVVIATSKWMDARYGVPLQAYLLKNCFIDCIYDSAIRSFSADVNTIITIMRKTDSNPGSNLVRFVEFHQAFGKVDGGTMKDVLSSREEARAPVLNQLYRIMTVRQTTLYQIGLATTDNTNQEYDNLSTMMGTDAEVDQKGTEYVGSKWGNLFLRAPVAYYTLLEKSAHKLKPIGSCFRLIRGVTSGQDDFFFLKRKETNDRRGIDRFENGFGFSAEIESQFCPPAVCDPEDAVTYSIKAEDLSYHIFICWRERKSLKGTRALRYIEWAETSPDSKIKLRYGKSRSKEVRIYDQPTMKSRGEWYQVPRLEPARIFLPEMAKNRHLIPLSAEPLYAADSFYLLYAKDPIDLWLYLNSSIFRLFMELYGRSEGAGALHMMVYEYKQCPLPWPLPNLSKEFSAREKFMSRQAYRFVNVAEEGPLELQQQDRKELDNLVLKSMGFTDERKRAIILSEIYTWLQARVKERLLKPKTAPKGLGRTVESDQADLRQFA